MFEIPTNVDLLIVGSGPVGSAFARTVRDALPNAAILMVERGPVATVPPAEHVRNLPEDEQPAAYRLSEGTNPQKIDAFEAQFGKPLLRPRAGTQLVRVSPAGADPDHDMPAAIVASNVGGMGSLWTCATPSPHGTERITSIPEAELETVLTESARLLNVTTTAFSPSAASRTVIEKLSRKYNPGRVESHFVQPMPLACRAVDGRRLPLWSGSDVVLGDLLDSTDGTHNFWLLPESAAVRIDMDGDTATGATIRTIGQTDSVEVKATVVVVAADAFRTPQLLWASGIRPTALGRYLNDQPQIVCAVYVDDVEATAADRGAESLSGVTWLPFDSDVDHPFHGQIMQMDTSPIPIGPGQTADPRPAVGVGIFSTKEIRDTDRVYFDQSDPDEFGLPGIRIDYDLTGADHAMVARSIELVREIGATLGEIIPGGEPIILPAGSSIHYQGTVRMGPVDDGTSTCDSHSLVWGTTNVFVGGNGVIPTATACNPTLTSVALAVRASSSVIELLTAPTS